MIGISVLGPAAFAETVAGKVAAVNAKAGSLQVSAVNPATKAVENVSVALSATTIYSGVASAAEIQTGDKVWVETVQASGAGPLTADSVKVSKG